MLLRLDCHYPLQQFLDPEDWYKRILITNDEIMRIKNKAGVSKTAVLSAMVYEIMGRKAISIVQTAAHRGPVVLLSHTFQKFLWQIRDRQFILRSSLRCKWTQKFNILRFVYSRPSQRRIAIKRTCIVSNHFATVSIALIEAMESLSFVTFKKRP